jgi:alkylation response protein AidB-like acyl-CoA dehydrogenase
MDFELSDDEVALAEGIRSLCAGRFPLKKLREAEDSGAVGDGSGVGGIGGGAGGAGGGGLLDADGWSVLAEAGVFSLQVPESAGGVGLGMAAGAVVFEELGRALLPGPLLASHLAATSGLVEGAAEGKVVVGSVRRSGSSGVSATSGPGALVPTLVPHLTSLRLLVVVGENGLEALDPAELIGSAVRIGRPLDPLTPLWRIDRLPEGRPLGGPAVARSWRRSEWILGGAFLVGLAAANLELAVSYAKLREQFGKPIGSFQAVKHMAADMLVAAETARAAVHAAAVTADQPEVGDVDRAAAGAGLLAAEAAIKNGNLYLMRARVLAEAIGPLDDLSALLAEIF